VQTFSEWLEAKLAERGWNAADLTAASRDDDNPRGIDSGLISRWRKPAPFGSVPTQARTLQRLARAFRVPLSEVEQAAGVTVSERQASNLNPRLASFLSEIETAWLAADEKVRAWGEQMSLSAFHIDDMRTGRTAKKHGQATIRRLRGRPNSHTDGGSDEITPVQRVARLVLATS
jgi:hypothetical protein